MQRQCSIPGCSKPYRTTGFCNSHFLMWKLHGDPLWWMPINRFMRQVEFTESCWFWTGPRGKDGYGRFALDGKVYKAHRWIWEFYLGPISEGLQMDHLCRVRCCVCLGHLDVVTIKENLMRSPIAPASVNARKTHCKRGHEFTEENTHWKSNGRHRECRQCREDWLLGKYGKWAKPAQS